MIIRRDGSGTEDPHQTEAERIVTRRIHVRGLVQVIGCRPYLHRIARKHRLKLRVWNVLHGVFIEVQGPHERVFAFQKDLLHVPPPLAIIQVISYEDVSAKLPADEVLREP